MGSGPTIRVIEAMERHTSVLLDGGVSIREVSEYLGHHDPGFTLRTYAPSDARIRGPGPRRN